MNIRFGGLQKTSLIDYPGMMACILFTQGCNFNCGYCHNPELLSPENWDDPIPIEDILEFLESRRGKLDAVVLTGGEPTLYPDLMKFIARVKELGFKIKLDTNGTNPSMLQGLLDEKLIDYVAMDIKAPLRKYSAIVGKNVRIDHIVESINLIIQRAPDYEFRTTVVEGQLDFLDLLELGQDIAGAQRYFLQSFIPTKTNSPEFLNKKAPSREILQEVKEALREIIPEVEIR